MAAGTAPISFCPPLHGPIAGHHPRTVFVPPHEDHQNVPSQEVGRALINDFRQIGVADSVMHIFEEPVLARSSL
jgi:hypothetical protein